MVLWWRIIELAMSAMGSTTISSLRQNDETVVRVAFCAL